MRVRVVRKLVTGLAAAIAFAMVTAAFPQPAFAGQNAADKVAAGGSTLVVFSPGTAVTLLDENIKTSSPTDLILQVTAECAISISTVLATVDITIVDSQVRIWVEVDGVPVAVSTDDTVPGGVGKVVFCQRVFNQFAFEFGDFRQTFDAIRHSNAFNWLRLNLGEGTHNIKVKADLIAFTASGDLTQAAVGKRTLIVEPTKLASKTTTVTP